MPESAGADYDVLVAGGGPVGNAIALALADSPLRIGLATPAVAADADSRPIALSHGSGLILGQLGCGMPPGATAITAIHVSHQGRFGRTLIRAEEHSLAALGHVVAYDALNRTTASQVACARIEGRVQALEHHGHLAAAVMHSGSVNARLVVLADGGHLAVSQNEDYGQIALVGLVDADQAHVGRAWERFTPEGPLALLPYVDTQHGDARPETGAGRRATYAMVWCMQAARAAGLLGANDHGFLTALQQAFGYRAGRFTACGARTRFPLTLRRALRAPPRCVTVGNAAQTLHPVAGQGLNLGLRDGMELARLIRDSAPQDLGSPEFVSRFEAVRAPDRNAGVRVTDTLTRLFSNASPLAGPFRGAGLFMLDLLPAPRHFLARRMMFGMRALP